jgi:hypothetical protein
MDKSQELSDVEPDVVEPNRAIPRKPISTITQELL